MDAEPEGVPKMNTSYKTPFLFIFAATFLLQLILPWWVIIPICFTAGYLFFSKGLSAWTTGFLAVATLWTLIPLFIFMRHDGRILVRVADLAGIPDPLLMWLMVTLAGGLLGGFSVLTGCTLRNLVRQQPRSRVFRR